MQVAPQIRFRGMDPSPAVEAAIADRLDALARFHGRITACSVVVEAPHRHQHKGKIYQVRIVLKLPGHEIQAGHTHELDHAHEDVYVAVRDAFDAARRQLEDIVRGDSPHRVKTHAERLQGKVDRLVEDDGFGFIAGDDGSEYFFRRESMTSAQDWQKLVPGAPVRFTAHEGEKGPYASAVTAG